MKDMKELKWVIALIISLFISSLVYEETKSDLWGLVAYIGIVIIAAPIIHCGRKKNTAANVVVR